MYSGRPTRTTVFGMPICLPTRATSKLSLSSSVTAIITSLSAISSASKRSKSVASPLITMDLSTRLASFSQRLKSFSMTLTENPACSKRTVRFLPNRPAPMITARL